MCFYIFSSFVRLPGLSLSFKSTSATFVNNLAVSLQNVVAAMILEGNFFLFRVLFQIQKCNLHGSCPVASLQGVLHPRFHLKDKQVLFSGSSCGRVLNDKLFGSVYTGRVREDFANAVVCVGDAGIDQWLIPASLMQTTLPTHRTAS